jgi:hypothetical protein
MPANSSYILTVRQGFIIPLIAAIFLQASSAARERPQKIAFSEMERADAIVVSHRTQGCGGGIGTFMVFQKNLNWLVTIMSEEGGPAKVMLITGEEVRALDQLLDHFRSRYSVSGAHFPTSTREESISLVHYRFGRKIGGEEFHDRTELSKQHSINFRTLLEKALYQPTEPLLVAKQSAYFRMVGAFLLGAIAGGFVIWRSRQSTEIPKTS